MAAWITVCFTTNYRLFLVIAPLAALTAIIFLVVQAARAFFHSETDEHRGLRALIVTAAIGLPLPLALVARGEALERLFETPVGPWAPAPYWLGRQAPDVRRLVAPEAIILARPPKPELIADLRSDDPAQVAAAARAVELNEACLLVSKISSSPYGASETSAS